MKLNFAAGAVVPLKLSRLFRTDPLKNSTTIGVSYDHNLVSYTHTHTHIHTLAHTLEAMKLKRSFLHTSVCTV